MQSKYENKDNKFTCFDESKTISYEYVNDDYCDCQDGSDEPGTSACNNGVFVCRNHPHREKSILSVDVNDGICNCCDGSDEPTGKCKDTCFELAEEERKKREAYVAMIQSGRQKAQVISNNYQSISESVSKRLEQQQTEHKALQQLNSDHQQKLEKITAVIEIEKNKITDSWNLKIKKDWAMEIFSLIDENTDNLISRQEIENSEIHRFYKLDAFLAKLTEGQIQFEEFELFWTSSAIETIIDEEKTKTHSEEDLEDDDRDAEKDEDEDAFEYGEDGVKIPKEQPKDISPPSYQSRRRRRMKEHLNKHHHFEEIHRKYTNQLNHPQSEQLDSLYKVKSEIEEKLKTNNHLMNQVDFDIKRLNSFFSLDFGPERTFLMLFYQCFNTSHHSIDYTICPFSHGVQNTSSGSFILGYWKGWDAASSYSSMLFEDGDPCYSDIKRSFQIDLTCATENEIISVDEFTTCKYVVKLQTPSACFSAQIPDYREEL